MTLLRRTVLASVACLGEWSAAAEAPTALLAYEAATGGRIGVHAENAATGAAIAWRADERFVMCSTFKASLAGLVLSRVDLGLDRLESQVRFGAGDLLTYAPVARAHLSRGVLSVGELCAAAVEYSDNTCANLLLARVGGPAQLTRFWRTLGDGQSRLDHNEPMLNRTPPGDVQDTTTPAAMAGTLRRLVLGDSLSRTSRQRLVEWLVACKTGADRLRGGLPGSWTVGDKTGSNGHDAFGDIAVAWNSRSEPIVVCAYTWGGAPSADVVATTFKEIGALVAARLA
ncbi:MAG TPA: class A beta-lactamase [Caldimonas sp.]|nr:class A beta-lactamase [Caldimonas sp.]